MCILYENSFIIYESQCSSTPNNTNLFPITVQCVASVAIPASYYVVRVLLPVCHQYGWLCLFQRCCVSGAGLSLS